MKQLVSLLLFTLSLNAHNQQIIEHHHFDAINHYLTPCDLSKNTVIILDIDNTIAQPDTIIGSEEWVAHMIGKGTTLGQTIPQAVKNILPLYFDIIHTINFSPVELITIGIIRELQKSGVIVIGLTARSLEIADRTIDQLYAIGIDLSQASIWPEDFSYDCCTPYAYKDGIIFCAGADKGKILMQVFERLNYCPCKIIAIDDKEKHLHAIAKAIDPCIEFIGIRYGHLDDKVRNFDGVAADEQLLEWIIWQWLFERY